MIPSDFSSVVLSVNFDWSLDQATRKITTPQEAFKFDSRRLAQGGGSEENYPYEVVDTKLKVRGAGRAMRIRYSTTQYKDFRLLGYALIGISLNDTEASR